MHKARRLLMLVLVLGMTACLNRPLVEVDPVVESFVKHEMTQVQFSGVDILVVVDNSMSMAEEQANLAANFPILVSSLLDPPDSDGDTVPDHVPVRDLHIGVVSTDMGTGGYSVETCPDPIDGDNGELQHHPNPSVGGCDATYPTYLSYESEEPDATQIDWISRGFGCIAVLGINGCGFEQQLKAAAKALIDHRDGVNAGFLRNDSILTILFVTDEEDCSVKPGSEGIFDTMDSGFGNEIPTCLDHPDMVEEVDPVSMTRLVPSCVTSTGEAYPPRRFVQIAQQFGERALVHSICTSDFTPAIQGLTDKLHEIVDAVAIVRELETENDPTDADGDTVPDDPCRCVASCKIIEALSDLRTCESVGKPCYEPAGPGTGCSEPEVDPDGLQHTLCEIPQAATRMSPCNPATPPGCNDTGITHLVEPGAAGWYYMGRNWTEEGTGVVYTEPQILFTEGSEPEEGSNVYIQCESFICPLNRQCGDPALNRAAVCCDWDEFCAEPDLSTRHCAPRPD
jgi:hypothetical protein